jgi:hypothetical protein
VVFAKASAIPVPWSRPTNVAASAAGIMQAAADKHHIDVGFGRRQRGAELGDKFADGIEIDGFAIDETLALDEFFVGHIDRFLFDLTGAPIAVRHFAGKTPARVGVGFRFPAKIATEYEYNKIYKYLR